MANRAQDLRWNWVTLLTLCFVTAVGCQSAPVRPKTSSPKEVGNQASSAGLEHTLGGRVLDAQGCPIAHARVLLLGQFDLSEQKVIEWLVSDWRLCTFGLGEYLVSRGEVILSTTSGLDGSYGFEGLSEGTYTLRVTADNFAYQEKDVVVGEMPRS